MRLRSVISLAAVAVALVPCSAASAKNLRPGDIRLCNDHACVGIVDRGALQALSRFYYAAPAPAEARPPRIGAPYFKLMFSNGYVTGIAASTTLDRFRTGGVDTAQFGPDSWYRIPPGLARSLRTLATRLRPLRVTSSTVGPTRYG
jgi:hypothetical protein